MRRQTIPQLTLVGAGPGDPDLISVKGIKALADADAVLYDALVSEELLTYAPNRAALVYVGKRAGKHSFKQDGINELIVHYAKTRGHVVRLKGGDPFVFGRGFEEIAYAEKHGLKTTLVPGITSATGVPAMQNIPLTVRCINHGFWVITGTTSRGELSNDITLAAQSTATIVILMGMNQLQKISEVFIRHGKAKTPAAVIQNGTLPHERAVFGMVENIEKEVRKHAIGAPAIIVIGETVNCYKREIKTSFKHEMIGISHGQ